MTAGSKHRTLGTEPIIADLDAEALKNFKPSVQPVVTDVGFCLAINAEPTTKLFREGAAFGEVFKSAFSEDMDTDSEVLGRIHRS